LVLTFCLLAFAPDRLARWERVALVRLVGFMIAAQQSSVAVWCGLLVGVGVWGLGVDLARYAFARQEEMVPHGPARHAPPPLEGLGREADQGWGEGWQPPNPYRDTPPPVPLPQGEGGRGG
jgi:hypothetical protein